MPSPQLQQKKHVMNQPLNRYNDNIAAVLKVFQETIFMHRLRLAAKFHNWISVPVINIL